MDRQIKTSIILLHDYLTLESGLTVKTQKLETQDQNRHHFYEGVKYGQIDQKKHNSFTWLHDTWIRLKTQKLENGIKRYRNIFMKYRKTSVTHKDYRINFAKKSVTIRIKEIKLKNKHLCLQISSYSSSHALFDHEIPVFPPK